MKRFMFIVAATVIVAACSQNGGVDAVLNDGARKVASGTQEVVTGIQSVYDSVGMFHNSALAYVDSVYGFDSELTIHQCSQGLADWLIQLDPNDGLNTAARDSLVNDAFRGMMEADSLHALGRKACFDKYPIGNAARSFVDSILLAFDSLSINGLPSTLATFVRIENQVVGATELTDKDEIALLSGLAVARYSLEYWWVELGVPSKSGADRMKAMAKAEKIAEGDAKGAITGACAGFVGGAIKGAVVGSIGGPLGTLGGACGGAVTSSLSGGVMGAIKGSLSAWLGW